MGDEVSLTVDGHLVTVPVGHLHHARRRRRSGSPSPNSAPPTACRHSAPAGCAWSKSKAGAASTPPAPNPCSEGMAVQTQNDHIADIRRGVMELYISDHPLDCLTCSANGDCELQDMAGAVGLREVRLRERREPPGRRSRRVESLLLLRSVQVHRLFALRARLRRGAGNVCPHDRRPRFRRVGQDRGRGLLLFRVRVVRRLRPGLSDGDPHGEVRDRPRRAGPRRQDHLRLLRRRLFVQGRTQGRPGRAHDAGQGWLRQSRPLLREGTLRMGLRQPPGTHPRAHDPRQHRRAVARGLVGRGDRPCSRAAQGHPGGTRSRLHRRHHLLALHQRRSLGGHEDDPGRLRQPTTSTPARAYAIRPPATA